MDKMFIGAPKIMRKVSTSLIWICYPFCNNCVSYPRRSGLVREFGHLKPIYLITIDVRVGSFVSFLQAPNESKCTHFAQTQWYIMSITLTWWSWNAGPPFLLEFVPVKLANPLQRSGRILGIIGWDPSVCKSNRLHVDILRFPFIKLGYIL